MRITLTRLLIVCFFLFSFESYTQGSITPDDLRPLLGEWTGTLTYTDYGTNKPFTMPAELIVAQGKSENQLLMTINYPNEPNANSMDKIRISNNGTQVNKIDVTSKEILQGGDIQVTTEYSGKDNKKKALIRSIYIIGESQFVIRKEVKFEDSEKWLVRNEYKYSR